MNKKDKAQLRDVCASAISRLEHSEYFSPLFRVRALAAFAYVLQAVTSRGNARVCYINKALQAYGKAVEAKGSIDEPCFLDIYEPVIATLPAWRDAVLASLSAEESMRIAVSDAKALIE